MKNQIETHSPAHQHIDIVEGVKVEKPDFSKEIIEVKKRISEYQNKMRQADKVVIMFGCDDGRVVVSPEPQTAVDGQTTLYVFIPKIGGGAPSRELFTGVLSSIRAVGVPSEKIEVIATQHGSTEEVELTLNGHNHEADGCISCGLRKVFSTATKELSALGGELRKFPTTTKFDELPEEVLKTLEEMSAATKIPARLLRRAAERNFSGDMDVNGEKTADVLRAFVLEEGLELKTGLYDHQKKQVHLTGDHAGETLGMGVNEWTEKHQDPAGLVVSYGPVANVTHHSVVLPDSVAAGTSNDFSAAAIGNEENLLDALNEVWYAASHNAEAAHGHAHDRNFNNTVFCTIICDNAEFVLQATEVIKSREFKEKLSPAFEQFGKITLINLESESVTDVPLVA